MPQRPGEQLSFQPQPPPAAGKDLLPYRELSEFFKEIFIISKKNF